MSSDKFVWEPGDRLIPGHVKLPPRVARDLLHHLDVETAPVDVQRQAIAAWLEDNPADPLMMASLRRRGLIS